MPFKETWHGNGVADGAVAKLLRLWQHASALWRHAVWIRIVTSHNAWIPGYEYSLPNVNRTRGIHKHHPHPLETMGHVINEEINQNRNLWLSQNPILALTHWGRVTHICVGKLTIIGSDNGLSPERRRAIIWTNAGILLIGPLGTNFSEMLIEIQTFSLKKIRLKMSSAKCCSFRLGLNVLIGILSAPTEPHQKALPCKMPQECSRLLGYYVHIQWPAMLLFDGIYRHIPIYLVSKDKIIKHIFWVVVQTFDWQNERQTDMQTAPHYNSSCPKIEV